MEGLVSPKAYEDTQRQKRDQEIRDLRAQYNEKKFRVSNTAQTRLRDIDSQISSKKNIEVGNGAGLGLIAGVILGIPECTHGASGAPWLGTLAICTVVGAIITKSIKSTSSLDSQHATVSAKMQEDLSKLDQECEAKVKGIEQRYQKAIDSQRVQFEEVQREGSVSFIGSPIAKEITDSMLTPLLETIRSCDRRPHIKDITVPFSFEVYSNKVTSTYGTYDFVIERVKFLQSIEEQAALANAVATAIHTEIIATFEVDPSGGEVDPMDIDYQYGADYVKASMTYHATNGNFVEARSF